MQTPQPSGLSKNKLTARLQEQGRLVELYRLLPDELERFVVFFAGDDAELTPDERHAALQSLRTLPYNDRNRILTACEQRPELNSEQVLNLVDALLADDLLVHDHVCSVLQVHGTVDFDRTIRVLQAIVRSGYPKTRAFAAQVLSELHKNFEADVRMLLVDWSIQEKVELREIVARFYALGIGHPSKSDFTTLDLLSQDEYSCVRVQVAQAMALSLQKQVPEAFPIVERLTRDNRFETAATAITGLASAGPYYIRQALRLLRSLLQHELRGIRRRAAKSLGVLATQHPRRTLTYYRNIVRERDYMDIDVLHTVLRSLRDLAESDPMEARKMMVELVQDDDETISATAQKFLDELDGAASAAVEM